MSEITASPNPVAVGDHTTVRYTFPPGFSGQVTLRVTFDTAGDPIVSYHNVTPHDPTAVIDVPEGALGCTVVDESGGAEALNITVTP